MQSMCQKRRQKYDYLFNKINDLLLSFGILLLKIGIFVSIYYALFSLNTPFSVIMAKINSWGVTSKEGLYTFTFFNPTG